MSGRSWTAGAVRATPARLVMPIVAAERKHERPRAASPRALPQRRRRARAGEPCDRTAHRRRCLESSGRRALSPVPLLRQPAASSCSRTSTPDSSARSSPALSAPKPRKNRTLTIDLLLHTLATPLQLLRSPRWNGRVRVKRDDLLHGGLGSKTRKYDTLIPRLRAQGVQRVAVVTSPFGSNAFAAPSMLLPHRFQVHLIHPETRSVSRSRCTRAENLVGNALLSSMLVPQPHRHWFPHAQLEESVARLLASWTAEDGGRSVVLPEGLTVRDALRGAVQLGREVAEQAPTAPEIFVDAGTGHTAAGVIFALHTLGHPACVTVVGPCAPTDDPGASFARKLQRWHADFVAIALEELGQRARVDSLSKWRAVRPIVGAAFGSVPAAVKRFAMDFAASENILLDPVYSAKLMMYLAQAAQISQDTVAILSGGVAIAGYSPMDVTARLGAARSP